MTTNEYSSTRLIHLKGSDYEVADGQPDIRGWNVKDINDQTIGEVDDLIFDERTLRVRYMVVDLDHGYFNLKKDRYVLVPIGAGEVPEKHHVVIIPNLSAATADSWSALPAYDHDRLITPEDEYRVRNVFTGAAIPTANADVIGDDFYNHEYYEQDNLHRRRNAMYSNRDTAATYPVTDTAAATTDTINTTAPVNRADTTAAPVNTPGTTTARDTYTPTTPATPVADRNRNVESTTIPVIEENVQIGKQQVRTGGAYIKARIVEKPIEKTVNLKEERLNIERNPVDRPANSTDFDTFKEGVIELEEHREVPVVNKEARVVEEINVNKEVSERTETVRDTIRKTEVDIENMKDRPGNYRNDDVRDR
jgi:stress response protein YsnF